jgi:glucose/mannose transport system substrate-binding protein
MRTTEMTVRWALKHAWSSPSDRAALAACSEELAKIGVAFADAEDVAQADALKQHGFELVEAVREGGLGLTDLAAVARRERWTDRIDPRAWQFMVHGAAVHGIPMGIHQSNCLWANASLADEIEREFPAGELDLGGWLRQAQRRVDKPFAIGRQAWQVGILFEALWLAEAGPALYRRALVDLEPDAVGGREMTRVLETMCEVRDLTDDALLDPPWRTVLAEMSEGRLAAMMMGDWVRAGGMALRQPALRGLRGHCVYIVDLFVPIGASPVSPRVAAALTSPGFQARFAQVKGSAPAVVDALGGPRETTLADAPSLTFDQCGGMRAKQALLEIVADHFLHQRDPVKTATRLGDAITSCKPRPA